MNKISLVRGLLLAGVLSASYSTYAASWNTIQESCVSGTHFGSTVCPRIKDQQESWNSLRPPQPTYNYQGLSVAGGGAVSVDDRAKAEDVQDEKDDGSVRFY